jgi:hypothetical protein
MQAQQEIQTLKETNGSKKAQKSNDSAAFEQYASQCKIKPYPEPNGPFAPEVASGGSLRDTTVIQHKEEEEQLLQGKGNIQLAENKNEIPVKSNTTGLPDNLKNGVENLSGYSMDDVKVHYNSSKPAQLQALAYAQGSDIHVAPGQEQHLAHEAWHVVQQKQGRVQPTMQMKEGMSVNNDSGLEREADVMGDKSLGAQIEIESRNLKITSGNQNSSIQKTSITIESGTDKGTGISADGDIDSVKRSLGEWKGTNEEILGANWKKMNAYYYHGSEKTLMESNRSPYKCAEPHALSDILKKQFRIKQLNEGWVKALHFNSPAIGEDGKAMPPCDVCQQWVDMDTLALKLPPPPWTNTAYEEKMRLIAGQKAMEEKGKQLQAEREKEKQETEKKEKEEAELEAPLLTIKEIIEVLQKTKEESKKHQYIKRTIQSLYAQKAADTGLEELMKGWGLKKGFERDLIGHLDEFIEEVRDILFE